MLLRNILQMRQIKQKTKSKNQIQQIIPIQSSYFDIEHFQPQSESSQNPSTKFQTNNICSRRQNLQQLFTQIILIYHHFVILTKVLQQYLLKFCSYFQLAVAFKFTTKQLNVSKNQFLFQLRQRVLFRNKLQFTSQICLKITILLQISSSITQKTQHQLPLYRTKNANPKTVKQINNIYQIRRQTNNSIIAQKISKRVNSLNFKQLVCQQRVRFYSLRDRNDLLEREKRYLLLSDNTTLFFFNKIPRRLILKSCLAGRVYAFYFLLKLFEKVFYYIL